MLCNYGSLFSTFESSLFKLSFCLCFYSAFQIWELLLPNRTLCSGLMFSSVVLHSGILLILLLKSKTDQFGHGRCITLCKHLDLSICAVSLAQQYLGFWSPSDKHFHVHAISDPLTIYQFHTVLKTCLKYLKIDHLPISSHLFCIGAATEAVHLDYESVIKSIGGWKSKCYSSYVCPNVCL